MIPLVDATAMRAIESATIVAGGVTWDGLMERAGAEVARYTLEWAGRGGQQRVLVLAGPGNNGGDALVTARHLALHGWHVECWTWQRREERPDLTVPLVDLGVILIPISEHREDFTSALRRSTLVLDGLLGTGLARNVDGDLARIVRTVQNAHLPIVAIDLPTGIDSDDGKSGALRSGQT